MGEPIISVSGLRGVLGSELTPPVAMRYAAAFAAELPDGPIVLGRDGRASGPLLCDAIRGTLVALGRSVLDADVAATPTVGVLVQHHTAAGGIQVSASHNPPQYNGIKLFSSQGRVLPAEAGLRVLRRYREQTEPPWQPHDQIGTTQRLADTTAEHLRRVCEQVDVARIRTRQFRVLLDANHGAGAVLGKRLLKTLGCRATVLGETPDGRFDHPAEPLAENLHGLMQQAAQAAVDVAFCQDPDADRLALLDAQGHYLGEEATLALCLDHVLTRRKGPVVVNCATSRMNEDIAARHGVPLVRAAVGEANVVDGMLTHGAAFGGEGNGGVIDPAVILVRDSFVAMAYVLEMMAQSERSLAELAAGLPRYVMRKTKLELPAGRLDAALESLTERFADARLDQLDGLRFDWPDAWLLARKSNTEPIVRVLAEATTESRVDRLVETALAALRKAGR